MFNRPKYSKNDASALDLAERKLAALDRSQGIIQFALDGTILDANENFLAVVGYSLAEVKGRHHSMFVSADFSGSPEYRAFWARLNDGVYFSDCYRRIGKGGRVVWIRASYNPLIGANGRPFGVIKIATDITDYEEQRAARLETDRLASESQRTFIEGLGQLLSRLAEGDLTVRMSGHAADAFASIESDFNAAAERLADTVRVVADTAETIRSGTQEVSNAADDLSRRTEQQAASLEETTAALREITATVRKTSDDTKQAREVVIGAKADAERSGTIVKSAIAAMGQIETSSGKIGQIIGVIDEIAFQTNLLALNAGVEAARAGDAGRGFAVVASEVRALAQRSAEAAKEIKVLVHSSSEQVESGVGLVADTGKALDGILSHVARIDALMGGIAASAQEQATALDEVNTAVGQMDEVTQRNAAMIEETTAASHGLSEEAARLSQSLSSFSIGRQGIGPASARVRALPRPAARQAAVPALKVTGRGGAARAAKPAAGTEAWEEF